METQDATDEEAAKKQFRTYLGNPQRWNRYPYVLNNPLLYTDPNGEDVTIYYRPAKDEKDVGHILIYVRNDETGESAYFDYSPLDDDSLVLPVSQGRIDSSASITIETSAEQEEAILGGIEQLQQSTPDWSYFGPNCVSKCQDLLSLGGININGITPYQMFNDAFKKYGDQSKAIVSEARWPGFPSAASRYLLFEMLDMFKPEIVANSINQFLCCESASRFNDSSLAMYPTRLNWI